MGRDLDCGVNETKSLVVSIHAPAWGATYKAIDTGLEQYVSIHAPAWGATYESGYPQSPFKVSIHAPAWGATTRDTTLNQTTNVSIHAPAWGATKGYVRLGGQVQGFNPRARMGRDLKEDF